MSAVPAAHPPIPTGAAAPPARGERFALFAECLLAGVLTAVAALPMVTALPALAAGCAHVRAQVAGESTAVRLFWRRFAEACRCSARATAVVLTAAAVLTVDLLAVRAGLPGGPAVAAVSGLAAAALAVVTVRAAAAWRPGADWARLFRSAARRSPRDPAGSLRLIVALGATAVLTWQLRPLLVPMLGLLALAAVGVDGRVHPDAGPDGRSRPEGVTR